MKLFFGVFVIGALLYTAPVYAVFDTDKDGLDDDKELTVYYTDPIQKDTDGDGFSDGEEIRDGFSPLAIGKKLYEVDTDKDKLNDLLELNFGTNLNFVDTDRDAENDYEEVMHGRNPTSSSLQAVLTRRVETDLTTQMLHYIVDEKLIFNMPISSGNPRTPTPTGTFKILYKVPKMRYRGVDYDLPGVKWNMAFTNKGHFLHTAYWHNNFGKKTNSHGCINMREADAALLYTYLDVGVEVRVVGKTPKNGKVIF